MRRSKIVTVILAALVCVWSVVAAEAANGNAIVDFKTVFDGYPKCLEARKVLSASIRELKSELAAKLQKETDEGKRNALVTEYNKVIKQRTVEILTPVVDEVKSTSEAVAKAKGLDKVYDKTDGVKGVDITEAVAVALSQKVTVISTKQANKSAEVAKAEAAKGTEVAKANADAQKAAQEAKEKAEAEKAAEIAKEKANAEKVAQEAKAKAEAAKAAEVAKAKADAEKAAQEAKTKAEAAKAAEVAKAKTDTGKATQQTKATVSDKPKASIEVQFGADYDEPDITRMVNKALKNGISGAYVNSIIGKKGKKFCRARVPASSNEEAKAISQKLKAIGFSSYIVK